MAQFELFVSKADFKFSCAHFIIHEGGRERLHGHNYQLSVRILGGDTLCSDGYLIDFGQVKKEVRNLCKDINESFICPVKSPHLRITRADDTVCLDCIDGSRFVFPRQDCTLLPLFHSSVEELAHYFWFTLVE
jgi:6-pyruvoyltetrahydropterin/6-carboxytetrahydropterin synthase